MNVGNRKLLEIFGTSQVVNNTDDVNHSELTNLLFNFLVENVNECKYYDIPMPSSCFVQNQNSLSVFHVNIRSLNKNFDALYELILSLPVSPDVICASKTRTKGNPLINISIPNYSFFHKDSLTNAGEVAIYVSKKHQFKVIQEFKLTLKGCEEFWIKLISNKYSTHDIINGAIYRHPTKSIETYTTYLVSCGSLPIITLPTRVTEKSSTIIDHTVTNDTSCTLSPGVIHCDISDHYPIFCYVTKHFINSKLQTSFLFRDKLHFNVDSYCKELNFTASNFLANIEELYKNNFDVKFDAVVTLILNVINNHAPIRRLSRTKQNLKSLEEVCVRSFKTIKSTCFESNN